MFYVYAIGPVRQDKAKIGVTSNLLVRRDSLQIGNWHPLEVLGAISCLEKDKAYEIEARAHVALAEFRITGEWFDVSSESAIEALQEAARIKRNPVLLLFSGLLPNQPTVVRGQGKRKIELRYKEKLEAMKAAIESGVIAPGENITYAKIAKIVGGNKQTKLTLRNDLCEAGFGVWDGNRLSATPPCSEETSPMV